MGLDMYLEKRTYVKNWPHTKPEEKHKVTVKGPMGKTINPDRVTYIIEGVAQWRKANQIHGWFVNNVQGGDDDCKEHWVSQEQLQELVDLCKEVMKRPTEAKDLLPVQQGFFFGNESYDQYYFQDIKYTIETLETLLKENPTKGGDLYYSSSW